MIEISSHFLDMDKELDEERSVPPSTVITDEILMRIPLESLMKFKAGCKEWNTRLSEPDFIFKHFDRSRERFLGIDDKVRVINPTIATWKYDNQSCSL